VASNDHCRVLFELSPVAAFPVHLVPEENLSLPAPRAAFAEQIIAWQRTDGRHDLPWHSTDPYRVWLSEVMLQQTQVSTVVDYYKHFLARFPSVKALAASSQDDVLASWSGLGYYSRARNLHRCAQIVVEQWGGNFPTSSTALQQLPGIGPSTAAAIAAFCFGERVAILDGNVRRVLTRWLSYKGDLSQSSHIEQLWAQATALLPANDQMPAYTQGLMDLGATVCITRKPKCHFCPIRDRCQAAKEGVPENYPVKTRKPTRGCRESVWLLLSWHQKLCLVQRPQSGVWAGLWSLPEYAERHSLQSISKDWPGTSQTLASLTHQLTHLSWTLHPLHWRLPDALHQDELKDIVQQCTAHAETPSRWLSQPEAFSLGIPAPLRKLLEQNPSVWS
jgi:A/G-specific adenine glycosylase